MRQAIYKELIELKKDDTKFKVCIVLVIILIPCTIINLIF